MSLMGTVTNPSLPEVIASGLQHSKKNLNNKTTVENLCPARAVGSSVTVITGIVASPPKEREMMIAWLGEVVSVFWILNVLVVAGQPHTRPKMVVHLFNRWNTLTGLLLLQYGVTVRDGS